MRYQDSCEQSDPSRDTCDTQHSSHDPHQWDSQNSHGQSVQLSRRCNNPPYDLHQQLTTRLAVLRQVSIPLTIIAPHIFTPSGVSVVTIPSILPVIVSGPVPGVLTFPSEVSESSTLIALGISVSASISGVSVPMLWINKWSTAGALTC